MLLLFRSLPQPSWQSFSLLEQKRVFIYAYWPSTGKWFLHHFCWFQSVSTKNRIFFCGQVCWSFQLTTQQVLLSLNTTQYLKFVSQSTMSRTSFCLTLSISITKLLEPTVLIWNVTWAKHLENAVQIMRTVSVWRRKLGIISTDWRKFLTTKTVESGPSLYLDKDCPFKEP